MEIIIFQYFLRSWSEIPDLSLYSCFSLFFLFSVLHVLFITHYMNKLLGLTLSLPLFHSLTMLLALCPRSHHLRNIDKHWLLLWLFGSSLMFFLWPHSATRSANDFILLIATTFLGGVREENWIINELTRKFFVRWAKTVDVDDDALAMSPISICFQWVLQLSDECASRQEAGATDDKNDYALYVRIIHCATVKSPLGICC